MLPQDKSNNDSIFLYHYPHVSFHQCLAMGHPLFCPITLADAAVLSQTVSAAAVHRPGGQFMLFGQYMGLVGLVFLVCFL